MQKSIFDFSAYTPFLDAWIRQQPRGGHGLRAELATLLGRQSVFLSQVLHGKADLTPSQALLVSERMKLSGSETEYFLTLVHLARADSPKLRDHYEAQLEAMRERNLNVKSHLGGEVEGVPQEDRLRYYSAWYYGAIRILTSIGRYQERAEIVKRLQLPEALVAEVLDFLCQLRLVERKGDRFRITSKSIHLGNDSALISRHHVNWRLRAMQSFDQERKNELHYSTAVVIEEKDAIEIKKILLEAIERKRKTVEVSGCEELYCVLVDFFRA